MNTLKIKKGDTVIVTTGKKGKDGIKGKKGKVIAVIPADNKVIVDGLRIQKRHKKPKNAQSQAGIIEQSGPIDASNVMVICPKCNKPTRIGISYDASGKKIRVCKRIIDGVACMSSLDKGVKAEKKAEKKAEDKSAEKAPKTAEKKTSTVKKTAVKAVETAEKAAEETAQKDNTKAAAKTTKKTGEAKAATQVKTAAKPKKENEETKQNNDKQA